MGYRLGVVPMTSRDRMTSSRIIIIDTKRATSQTTLPVSFSEVLVSFNRCALLRYLHRLILASEPCRLPACMVSFFVDWECVCGFVSTYQRGHLFEYIPTNRGLTPVGNVPGLNWVPSWVHIQERVCVFCTLCSTSVGAWKAITVTVHSVSLTMSAHKTTVAVTALSVMRHALLLSYHLLFHHLAVYYLRQEVLRSVVFVGSFVGVFVNVFVHVFVCSFVNMCWGPNISKTVSR